MSIRRWVVEPDEEHYVGPNASYPNGAMIQVCSVQACAAAAIAAITMTAHAGGVFAAYPVRERTGFPDEMVTTRMVFEWKDRTDARPQPEHVAEPTIAVTREEMERALQEDPAPAAARAEPEPEPAVPDPEIPEPPAAVSMEDVQAFAREMGLDLVAAGAAAVPAPDVDPQPVVIEPSLQTSADGLDVSALPDEDLESIPPSLR